MICQQFEARWGCWNLWKILTGPEALLVVVAVQFGILESFFNHDCFENYCWRTMFFFIISLQWRTPQKKIGHVTMMRSTMQDQSGFYWSFPQTFAKESTCNLLALRKSQWLVWFQDLWSSFLLGSWIRLPYSDSAKDSTAFQSFDKISVTVQRHAAKKRAEITIMNVQSEKTLKAA